MKEKKKCLMFKLMSDQKRYVLIVAEVFSLVSISVTQIGKIMFLHYREARVT